MTFAAPRAQVAEEGRPSTNAPARVADVSGAATAELARGELDRAIAGLRSAADASPVDVLRLGILERQRGDYAASVATFDRLLAAQPNDGEALLQRAYSAWHDGRLEAADQDLTAIVEPSGGARFDERLVANAEAARASLREERRDLAPVAEKAATLDVEFGLCVALAVVVALATVGIALRRE